MHYRRLQASGPLPPLPVVIGCSVEGCALPHLARGLCKNHYQRKRNAASALANSNAPYYIYRREFLAANPRGDPLTYAELRAERCKRTCLECGIEFAASKPSYRRPYCSKSCGTKHMTRQPEYKAARTQLRRYPDKPCEHCGTMFRPHNSGSRFCSRKCSARTRASEDARRGFRRGGTPKLCEYCGDEFRPKNQNQRHCSKSCTARARHARGGFGTYQRRVAYGNCAGCGIPLVRAGQKYCSIQCAGAAGTDTAISRAASAALRAFGREITTETLAVGIRYPLNRAERGRFLALYPKCMICGEPATDVDHWHDETQYVRGALCNPCNRSVGGFGDSAHRLIEAGLYVEALSLSPKPYPYRNGPLVPAAGVLMAENPCRASD
jgi:hypothetical protein